MKTIHCPICSESITVRPAKGRKSNKAFIMLVCPKDGRHFRGFITDQKFVQKVLDEQSSSKATGTEGGSTPPP